MGHLVVADLAVCQHPPGHDTRCINVPNSLPLMNALLATTSLFELACLQATFRSSSGCPALFPRLALESEIPRPIGRCKRTFELRTERRWLIARGSRCGSCCPVLANAAITRPVSLLTRSRWWCRLLPGRLSPWCRPRLILVKGHVWDVSLWYVQGSSE